VDGYLFVWLFHIWGNDSEIKHFVVDTFNWDSGNGSEVFVIFREHVTVICFANDALESAGCVLQISNVQGQGSKHACEQFAHEVDIFAFTLQSNGWSGDMLIRQSDGDFHCKEFEWRNKSDCIAAFHGLIVVLFSLGIEGDCFFMGDFGFLKFVDKCFVEHQMVR